MPRALRRFHVGVGALIRLVWRPVLAAAAMAAALAGSGLGWSDDHEHRGTGGSGGCRRRGYVAALATGWIVAGRPAGAETDVLALLRRAVR